MSADRRRRSARSIISRHEARADAGERQRELHAFRRGDRPAILILHAPAMMMTLRSRFDSGARPRRWERARRGAAAGAATSRSGSGADGVRRLGELYRAAAADLAFARRRFPGDPLVGRLEPLVLRGARGGLRARGAARVGVARSSRAATGGGWPSGRAAARGAGRCCWCRRCSGAVWGAGRRAGRRGPDARPTSSGAADPPVEGRDFDAADGVRVLRSQVMFNNIQVTLLAFAGGITFGAADGLRAVLQRAAPGRDRGARDRRRQRRRVPAADLLARAAGDLVHRRRRRRRAADGLGADPAGRAAARDVAAARGASRRSSWPRARCRGSCCAAFLEGFATGPELPVAVPGRARVLAVRRCSGGSCSCAACQSTARDLARR